VCVFIKMYMYVCVSLCTCVLIVGIFYLESLICPVSLVYGDKRVVNTTDILN
jgi:hypothetical protein